MSDEAVRFGDALWDSAVANRRVRRSLAELEKIVEQIEAMDDEADGARSGTTGAPAHVAGSGHARPGRGTSLFWHWLLYSALLILGPILAMLVAAALFSVLLYVLTR